MRDTPILEKPSSARRREFLAAVRRSRNLHKPWVSAPDTQARFDAYLERLGNATHLSYWVIAEDSQLAGVFNISEIVRGVFHSGYLGYYAFEPFNGQGYMTRGLAAVLRDAFRVQHLHRLEANIQPGNVNSKVLVRRMGFRQEGFSPRYLKIGGRWRDHERWAMLAEEWRAAVR